MKHHAENGIIIFLRAPEKGKVKTRLARELGVEKALDLYRNFVKITLAATDLAGVRRWLCFFPPDKQALLTDWLGDDIPCFPQSGADLGARMAHAFKTLFQRGIRQAVLVGTDIPGIRPALVQQAFAGLGTGDAVIGPSLDGGYWLIGFTRNAFLPGVFEDMAWSTAGVCADTLDRMRRAGLSVSVLPHLRDIDTLADLNAFERDDTRPLP